MWDAWKDYKKVQHRFTYKSPKSEQAALMQLGRLAGENEAALAIIEQSIANGGRAYLVKINKTMAIRTTGRKQRITDADRARIAADLQTAINKGANLQD